MIVHQYFDEVQTWCVVFFLRERPRTRFIHYLLNDDFVHCILLREMPDGRTLMIDPEQWGIAISFQDKALENILLEYGPRASAVLMHTVDYRRFSQYRVRGVYTCVTLCKAILGLWKCWGVQTPFGLYRLLLKYPTTTIIKPYSPYLPK